MTPAPHRKGKRFIVSLATQLFWQAGAGQRARYREWGGVSRGSV